MIYQKNIVNLFLTAILFLLTITAGFLFFQNLKAENNNSVDALSYYSRFEYEDPESGDIIEIEEEYYLTGGFIDIPEYPEDITGVDSINGYQVYDMTNPFSEYDEDFLYTPDMDDVEQPHSDVVFRLNFNLDQVNINYQYRDLDQVNKTYDDQTFDYNEDFNLAEYPEFPDYIDIDINGWEETSTGEVYEKDYQFTADNFYTFKLDFNLEYYQVNFETVNPYTQERETLETVEDIPSGKSIETPAFPYEYFEPLNIKASTFEWLNESDNDRVYEEEHEFKVEGNYTFLLDYKLSYLSVDFVWENPDTGEMEVLETMEDIPSGDTIELPAYPDVDTDKYEFDFQGWQGHIDIFEPGDERVVNSDKEYELLYDADEITFIDRGIDTISNFASNFEWNFTANIITAIVVGLFSLWLVPTATLKAVGAFSYKMFFGVGSGLFKGLSFVGLNLYKGLSILGKFGLKIAAAWLRGSLLTKILIPLGLITGFAGGVVVLNFIFDILGLDIILFESLINFLKDFYMSLYNGLLALLDLLNILKDLFLWLSKFRIGQIALVILGFFALLIISRIVSLFRFLIGK